MKLALTFKLKCKILKDKIFRSIKKYIYILKKSRAPENVHHFLAFNFYRCIGKFGTAAG